MNAAYANRVESRAGLRRSSLPPINSTGFDHVTSVARAAPAF
jgi:hypothetical protein